jgi:hypothetical protein
MFFCAIYETPDVSDYNYTQQTKREREREKKRKDQNNAYTIEQYIK